MKRWRWPRLGLRREVLLLVPLAMLALVLLSAFSLIAYRNGIESLRQERQGEARRLAWQLAQRLADSPTLSTARLRSAAPQARRVAVIDADGRVVASLGLFTGTDAMAPLTAPLVEPLAVGPSDAVPDAIAAFAPLMRGGHDLVLRVDLAAEDLARQLGGLRILTWVALPLNLAVVALVFLFLRYLLRPFETLLEQARRVDSPEPEGDDEVAFLVGTFERAVTALARKPPVETEIETLQRTLAPSLESGLLLLDREGGVLALNPVGCELLEVQEPQVGAPVEQALERHPKLVEILHSAASRGQGAARQEAEVRTAGGRRTLGLTVHALRRDDGAVRGFLVLFVDLTEVRRQAAEERLAEGLAQLGELAAGVAHELRNGLATLRGYLTLVARRPEDGTLTDYLTEMRRESDHLVRVVEDFLTFARPESARVAPVELAALARRSAADPALGEGAVRVEIGDDAAARIRGDAELLERALKNLLHNAVRAEQDTSEPAAVVCRVGRHESELAILIEDRGAGLPSQVRERLFQPFVTGRSDGVGLGLSLAHRIVGLHGGTLRLEDREGGGTRAVISFPADEALD